MPHVPYYPRVSSEQFLLIVSQVGDTNWQRWPHTAVSFPSSSSPWLLHFHRHISTIHASV
jgi:hypothetical protein